jgi:hypothetical protein
VKDAAARVAGWTNEIKSFMLRLWLLPRMERLRR